MNENTTKLLAALGLAHMSVMAIEAQYGKKYKNEIKLAERLKNEYFNEKN